jgi:hypothetical protein
MLRAMRHAAAALLLCSGTAAAQPATDIFVADVSLHGGMLHIGEPVNVTERDGYDNQPWFLPDGRSFLYVSGRDGQTDVFRYDLTARTATQLTHTPQNEYSPSLPGDGSRMLVVRWANDMSTGALWWYTTDGEPLAPAPGSVPRVGYYALADEHTLALFINDSIQSFMLADTRTGDTTRVGSDMGGSGPRAVPGRRAVSYLRRHDDGSRWLTRLDLDTRTSTPLVQMLAGVANYTWTRNGSVLAAHGSTIHEWRPGSEWRVIADFADAGIGGVTRIALSPDGDRMAFVAERPAR